MRRTLVVAVCIAAAATPARAQDGAPRLVYPTSDAADRLRLRELAGDTATLGTDVLRSASTMGVFLADSARRQPRGAWLRPEVYGIINSAIPYSMNDGALWAGRGLSTRITTGWAGANGGWRLIIAPELLFSSNAQFDFNRDRNKFFSPTVPEARWGGGFANFWYVQPFSADVPWRMGARTVAHLAPGQSGIWYRRAAAEVGATTENAWWGPGVRNAILLSDNAPGIPRVELRSAHPLRTRVGAFEWRWFSGALSESPYFDTDTLNDVRSIAAAALTWRPSFAPTLTVGAARAVYGTVSGYGTTPFHFFDVFRSTSKRAPSGLPPGSPIDSMLQPSGQAQLASLFARWVFPPAGAEVYAEWARQNFPRSLRDLLIAPSYSDGYTVGLQWRRPAPGDATTLRVQAEITDLEQSPGFNDREVDVFYTSRRVLQGYTQRGQVLGAAIGPGGSSQWLAVDRVSPRGSFGVTFSRVRWNEDVRALYDWPAYLGYCNHDVSVLPGVRGGHTLGAGYLSGELIVGTRLNAFFQNQSGCPTGGPSKIDEHNTTLSISYTPFAL